MRSSRFLLSGAAVAAVLGLGGEAQAAPGRAEGLVGDPAKARNFMFLQDDINIFLNPALVAKYRGRLPFSLGLAQAQGGVTLDPFGGALIPIGESFTLGLYLNRRAGLYADQAAVGAVWNDLTNGGGSFKDPAGGSTGTSPATPFLPIDLVAAFGSDSVQVGLGIYTAFARNVAWDDSYNPEDGDLTSTSTTTASTAYVNAAAGVRIVGDAVSPEFWLRYGGVSSFADQYTEALDGDGDLTTVEDVTIGVQGLNGISLGVRAPISADDFTITPGVSLGFAGGTPLYSDREAEDDPYEDQYYKASAVTATIGLGIEWSPDEDFRAVGTIAAEIDSVTTTHESTVSDAYSYTVDRTTTVRAPVASIGAEGEVLKNLVLRGCIRAGLGTSAELGYGMHEGEEGLDSESSSSLSGAGGTSLSAAGGFSLPFENVRVDVTAGGLLISQEEGSGFFSRADVTFILPD